jgi:hypothetical protein
MQAALWVLRPLFVMRVDLPVVQGISHLFHGHDVGAASLIRTKLASNFAPQIRRLASPAISTWWLIDAALCRLMSSGLILIRG